MRRFATGYDCKKNKQDASVEYRQSAHPYKVRNTIFLRPFVCKRPSAHVIDIAWPDIDALGRGTHYGNAALRTARGGHHTRSFREGTLDNKTLPTIGFLSRSSKSAWTSFSRFTGSKIACSRNTGYRWANKPYEANSTLLNIATIRKGTIELMQKAASTASPAEYPSRSIADIAVGVLCVKVMPEAQRRLLD
jgi:hypothetical protein